MTHTATSEETMTPLTTTVPSLVVISNVSVDDEDLFVAESPSSSHSIGTPPTPENRKFDWPRYTNEMVAASELRSCELTQPDLSINVCTGYDPTSAGKVEVERNPCSVSELANSHEGELQALAPIGEDLRADAEYSTYPSSSSTSAPEGKLITERGETPTNHNSSLLGDFSSHFQLGGGLVSWLHGDLERVHGNKEHSAQSPGDAAGADTKVLNTQRDSGNPSSGELSKKRGSSLFVNLYDKIKQKHEELELKLQLFDEPPYGTTQSATHIPASPTTRCLGAQETDAATNLAFASEIAASSQPSKHGFRRDVRIRSASSNGVSNTTHSEAPAIPRTRLRSLSFVARSPNVPTATDNVLASAAASLCDPFTVEECLADPKLAAEFISSTFPGDEWLLALLYSIEEYEALTTDLSSSMEHRPDTQIRMATAILERFLSIKTRPEYSVLQLMGNDVRDIISQCHRIDSVRPSVGVEHDVGLTKSQGRMLPLNLFEGVYTFVFEMLRNSFYTKFRLTSEYKQLLIQRIRQPQQAVKENSLQHLVPTFDQVIGSEWSCTVFWVYLFRTSHHHPLSFIMDVSFKLRHLQLSAREAQSGTIESENALRNLKSELLLVCRRYLGCQAAVLALPLTSFMLVRLRDELLADAAALQELDHPDDLVIQHMIEKLDRLLTHIRVDFKRMSFDRFASFRTSTLYRDFVIDAGSTTSAQRARADELTQLLRISRIPFHQTAVRSPSIPDLRELCCDADDYLFDNAISCVFSFLGGVVKKQGNGLHHPANHKLIYVSPREESSTFDASLKKVLSLLTPNQDVDTCSAPELLPTCFNFLAGSGDTIVYGAVWRFSRLDQEPLGGECDTDTAPDETQNGVCVLSRYPLIDGLRECIRVIASQQNIQYHLAAVESDSPGEDPTMRQILSSMRDALEHHRRRLLSCSTSPSRAPMLDTSLQDLFDCLSVSHAVQLFSLILQEKSIVLVSSSYSVLLSVSESLRAIIYPLAWSHVYVPVLPASMKAYLDCPTPFIFGLHTSCARHCGLLQYGEDLAVVNLDRDSITGGGDVHLPPERAASLGDTLWRLCKPRLCARDQIEFDPGAQSTAPFPSDAVRRAFQDELLSILGHLETFAFRFECADRTVAVVDTSNKSRQWPPDAARFYSAVLQTQAFSTYLGGRPLLS